MDGFLNQGKPLKEERIRVVVNGEEGREGRMDLDIADIFAKVEAIGGIADWFCHGFAPSNFLECMLLLLAYCRRHFFSTPLKLFKIDVAMI